MTLAALHTNKMGLGEFKVDVIVMTDFRPMNLILIFFWRAGVFIKKRGMDMSRGAVVKSSEKLVVKFELTLKVPTRLSVII